MWSIANLMLLKPTFSPEAGLPFQQTKSFFFFFLNSISIFSFIPPVFLWLVSLKNDCITFMREVLSTIPSFDLFEAKPEILLLLLWLLGLLELGRMGS